MRPTSELSTDILAFLRRMVPFEGDYGPGIVVPPFLETWLRLAFPLPAGDPAERNVMDCRSKKQGKSSLAAGVALYLATRESYAQIVIVSADQDQSKDRVFRAARFAVENGPLLPHARVFRTVIELDNHSTLEAIANEWRGAAGGDYAGVIADELHTFTLENQRRLFDELVIPPTRPHGVRWIASYAGFEGESLLLKEWWDRALAGQRVDHDLPIYRDEAASLLAFIDVGEASWRMPWTQGEAGKRYLDEQRQTERPNTFRRLWLNEWVSSESQFLPEGAWDACFDPAVQPLAEGQKRKAWFGADASTSRDLTALVGVANDTGRPEVVYVKAWRPRKGVLRRGKPTVDLEATIGAEVLRLHKAGQVLGLVGDPYQLHTLLLTWEKAGIKVIEMPQTGARVEADQGLYDCVTRRGLAHYGDPELNEHLANAVAVETPRGYRLAKERTSRKIDLAVALSMALSKAIEAGLKGKVRVTPNPFYSLGPGESFVTTEGGRGYVRMPLENTKIEHPLTAEAVASCAHRRRGCASCVRFYDENGEIEREYQQAEDIRSGRVVPLSDEELRRTFMSAAGYGPDDLRRIEAEEREQARFHESFMKAVHRKMRKENQR